MSEVTFFNETGMPHVACRVDGGWFGFKPKIPKSPVSKGYVDNSDRSAEMKYYIKFNLDMVAANNAVRDTVNRYQDKWYVLGVCDCVSFAADLARAFGLVTPPAPNMLPENLLVNLFALNPGRFSDSKLPG